MSKNQKGKGLGRGIDALFMNDLDTLDALEQVQETEQFNRLLFQKFVQILISRVKSLMRKV